MDAANNLVTYDSGGTQVKGAFYRPQPTGPLPAVLVLHTRGGLSHHERDFAAWLASQGYVAIAPDYFTPLGITSQTFDIPAFYTQYTDRARELLANGLGCLESLPDVDKQRIAVVGFSLGGYLDLMLATRDDVKAVVSYYGAYHGTPVSLVPTLYSLTDIAAQVRASVLILHGEADTTAPIQRARTVQQLLVERGKQAELVVYPGVEHEFQKVGTPHFDAKATADAQTRVLAFLTARLK